MFPVAAAPLAIAPSPDGSNDTSLVELWLSLKTSSHTRRAYAAEIARFLAAARKPLARVTLADLQDYRAALGQGSLKPATQNRALTAVKSLLSFGQEIGYLPFNVGGAVKLRPSPDALAWRILDEGEVARLIDAAPAGRDRTLVRLLYASGVRVSELCGLRWRDAIPRAEGGQITVFGKRGQTRTVLLKPGDWTQLQAIRDGAPDEAPVFPSRRTGLSLDPSQVRRIVYAAAARAGLHKKVSPHWLRHAHASHALERRAPIHLVQATLGHASISTTGRYLHARPTESSSLYLPE